MIGGSGVGGSAEPAPSHTPPGAGGPASWSDDESDDSEPAADGLTGATSDGLFRDVFEHLPVALLVRDANGHIVEANAAAGELYGYPRDELVGRRVRELVEALDTDALPDRGPVEDRSLVIDSVGVRRDGSRFRQEATLAAITRRGELLALALVRDVSEEQRVELELAILTDLARLSEVGAEADVARRALDAVRRLFSPDRAGVAVIEGDGAVEWLASEAMDEFIAGTSGTRPGDIGWLARVLATGRPELVDRQATGHETSVLSPLADRLGIRAYAVIPVQAGEEPTGLLGLVWDSDPPAISRDEELLATIGRLIGTALSNAKLRDSLVAHRRELAESEDRYRTLFALAPQPILIASGDGLVLDANEAASTLFARAREELHGRKLGDLLDIGDEPADEVLHRLARGDDGGTLRGRGTLPDGRSFPQETNIARATVSGRAVFLVQVRDLGDEERLEAERLQAQKMEAIGQLVAGVGHELNNPLSAIVAFSQLLEADPRLPPDMRDDASLMRQEADRTRRIVRNLLDFARQRAPERRPTDLSELVRRSLQLHSYALGVARVTTRLDLPGGLPHADVDPSQILQVLLNLIHNAIGAIEEQGRGGTITIAARHVASGGGSDRLELRVTDDGPGVPEHVRSRLFEPFFTTKPVGEGTGLGLSVSYGIVASHGGRLWFEAPASGGSTFVIELPALPAAAASTAPAQTASASLDSSDAERELSAVVLAVDDEPSIRIFLQRALERAGHEVTVADSGEAALEILDRLTFDVMLIDHRMSGLDGVETYKRAVLLRPELAERTVIMSGDVLTPTLHDFARSEGLRLLPKPFDIATVRAVVQEVVKAAG